MEMNIRRCHLSRDEMFKTFDIIDNGVTQADAAKALNTARGVIWWTWRGYQELGSPEEVNQQLQLLYKTDLFA